MLFCSSIYVAGVYCCFDMPGVIRQQIAETAHLSDTESSLMYTVYAYPNIVLPILGGVFLDKIGMR